VKIRVMFFGLARDVTGVAEEQIEWDDGPEVGQLRRRYEALFPPLAEMSGSLLIAVNEEFRGRSWPLNDGDEVAFLPPVSGGHDSSGVDGPGGRAEIGEEPVLEVSPGDFFRLTRDPIPTASLADALKAPEDGAVAVFEGIVRNHLGGRRTLYLEYEAYESMAVRKMTEIGCEARAKFAVDRIGIVHRLGRIEIGETSVTIVVTAAHRGPAFDACRFLIDRLKQVVPIWKKEFFEDGFIWAEGEQQGAVIK
jgi:molybdopterin converting factor subunit 1